MSVKEGKPRTNISDLLLMITLSALKSKKTATVVVSDSVTAPLFLLMNRLELGMAPYTQFNKEGLIS